MPSDTHIATCGFSPDLNQLRQVVCGDGETLLEPTGPPRNYVVAEDGTYSVDELSDASTANPSC
ncbi:MAG: hypothetical protein AB7V43_22435 [Acidimicrobiia bacterium]